MGSLFSRHRHRSRITEQDKAVLQLKQQRDKLNQMTKRIERQIECEHVLAKELVSRGRKERALLLLKKKKYLENLIQKTEIQLSNIEQLVNDIEFAQIEVEVLDGIKQGNDALKNMQKVMSLDDAEKIMSEAQDAVDYQRELNDLVSGGLSSKDYDAIERDLARLVEDEVSRLPEVPEHPIRDDKSIDERAKDSPRKQRNREVVIIAS
uniref:Charged multivesicular body protein 6 n=1 Tax=Trichobilharzia regenti TaxID=157069 RepID=A0AA85IY23_TRIRE|nr:unnamed protein product [Trichobilharzia regenti]